MDYYKIITKDNKMAICNSDNCFCSKWFHGIFYNPHVLKTHYLAIDNGKMCIFNIYNKNTPITQWWNVIYPSGFLMNESDYYVAQREDNKEAIFYKDNPDKPITEWWDNIYLNGLVIGKSSKYYIVEENNRQAVFSLDNKDKPVTKWDVCVELPKDY